MSTVLSRTWNDLARAIWPDADYVSGEGPFATVRGCFGTRTVYLHPTVDQARAALRSMHPFGTYGQCMQKHVLIALAVLDE
jgi:hypothetical protein